MECRKFQDRRHLQRKSAYALASLCVSIKASYSLIQDTKRGFFMPSNRVSDCRATAKRHGTRISPILQPRNETRVKRKTRMEIKCSQCGFTSNGPDSLAGKKLKCPKCGVEFVASGENAFAVVDDNPVASQYKKAIVEKPIGKIGTLEVTNKRVQGTIQREVPFGKGVRIEKTNIDVLLNLITGITVNTINNKPGRVIGGVLLVLGIAMLICGIALIADKSEFIGGMSLVFSLPFALDGIIFLLLLKDSIRLSLSISGVNHFIPFETSQKEEAEAKCKMLKDAKSEYERIACI